MLNIVLYQPEIPQNTGNIGRTCVAIGAKLWLIRPLGFRVDDHNMRRAGLDYWQHLDWEVCDSWDAFFNDKTANRFWYFTRFAAKMYSDVSYAENDVLVFGSETQGLPNAITQLAKEQCLRIPTTENVRSLNLSNAVAVGAYEAMRSIAGSRHEFGLRTQ